MRHQTAKTTHPPLDTLSHKNQMKKTGNEKWLNVNGFILTVRL